MPGLVKLPGRLPGLVPWNEPTGRMPGWVVVVTGVIDGRLPGLATIWGELPLGREIDGNDGTLGKDEVREHDDRRHEHPDQYEHDGIALPRGGDGRATGLHPH